jgi:hypothetical protein
LSRGALIPATDGRVGTSQRMLGLLRPIGDPLDGDHHATAGVAGVAFLPVTPPQESLVGAFRSGVSDGMRQVLRSFCCGKVGH